MTETAVKSEVPGVTFSAPRAIYGPRNDAVDVIIVTDTPNPCHHTAFRSTTQRNAIEVNTVRQQALVFSNRNVWIDRTAETARLAADRLGLDFGFAEDRSLRGNFDVLFGRHRVSGGFIAELCPDLASGFAGL